MFWDILKWNRRQTNWDECSNNYYEVNIICIKLIMYLKKLLKKFKSLGGPSLYIKQVFLHHYLFLGKLLLSNNVTGYYFFQFFLLIEAINYY